MKGVLQEQKMGPLSIWRHPEPGRRYVTGADVAEGKFKELNSQSKRDILLMGGQEKPDYSCGIVIDAETRQHCASYHGWFDTQDFSIALLALCYFYNTALLAIELNAAGTAVADNVIRAGYPNLFRQQKEVTRISPDMLETEVGWRTTDASKQRMLLAALSLMKERPDCTRDRDLIAEMRTLEHDPRTGQVRGKGRSKDDRVMAWAIAVCVANVTFAEQSSPQINPYETLSLGDRLAWASMKRRIAAHGSEPGDPRGRARAVPRAGRRVGAHPVDAAVRGVLARYRAQLDALGPTKPRPRGER